MIDELEKAENFIFMEYFIVERGEMWDTILEILVRKASQGVDVRFMYDGMCSLTLVPYNYPKQLAAKGIKCRMFIENNGTSLDNIILIVELSIISTSFTYLVTVSFKPNAIN